MPHQEPPLPCEIEDACAQVARTKRRVLLVGPDFQLLKRAAERIHELSDIPGNPIPVVVASCKGMPLDLVHRPPGMPAICMHGPGVSSVENLLRSYHTVLLSDVESIADNVATEIMVMMFAENLQARVIFSSGIDPDQWPTGTRKEALLNIVREYRRIDVGVSASGEVADLAEEGLTLRQDDDGRWVFRLAGKTYPPVSGKAHGFQYLRVLCDSPGTEFTPKELRDRISPSRTLPKGADTDRGRVRNALEWVLNPRKNIPSDVRTHLRRSLKYGAVCVYRPVPE
jgi:hypothetical protein